MSHSSRCDFYCCWQRGNCWTFFIFSSAKPSVIGQHAERRAEAKGVAAKSEREKPAEDGLAYAVARTGIWLRWRDDEDAILHTRTHACGEGARTAVKTVLLRLKECAWGKRGGPICPCVNLNYPVLYGLLSSRSDGGH